ncbi:MAG TPA: isocitrate lyase family protein, partial [Candidatus Xenobia bacterium]
QETREWFSSPRFKGIKRLYSARQVVEQRGTIRQDYTIARDTARDFYQCLRDHFERKEAITTFGPYSPGQAVMMRRLGLKGIYLGGWATSAKGSVSEDPGADLASYPLSQVPDEASTLVRALLAADKNQAYERARMSAEQLEKTPVFDFRPFIIADADTGHGGDAHVRNLIRRFVEVGVPGYHIEDQKPGVKKCGHQGGKVLVPVDEQIKRLNAARWQLDVMGVPGLIVARTDAEAANLLDNNYDERDRGFILGATNLNIPAYKTCFLAFMKRLHMQGYTDVNGHQLYNLSDGEYAEGFDWLQRSGLLGEIDQAADKLKKEKGSPEKLLDKITGRMVESWEEEAGVKTFAEAVADSMQFRIEEGAEFELSVDEWLKYAATARWYDVNQKARSMGIDTVWDSERSRTPEGYYQVRGSVAYAIAKSLAVAPFADLLWMETKTADLAEAREFAEAIHAVYPDKMLAYNLSPSFNWDTTGMSEDEMTNFPKELGQLGYVFNFITYGGHQIDGLAAEEFTTALKENGMVALARLQRKLRLLESPYKTPQSHVGGPRSDAALAASSGRTATTKAMGKGSTQFQHLVQTEVPPSLLESWLQMWAEEHGQKKDLRVRLRPHHAGSELLELNVLRDEASIGKVVFVPMVDRRNRHILSVRDQFTHVDYRQKRLMTLAKLFLIHRYKTDSVHYVSPTEDNERQAQGMKRLGLFDEVATEVGDVFVATVNTEHIKALLQPDLAELRSLVSKSVRRAPVSS